MPEEQQQTWSEKLAEFIQQEIATGEYDGILPERRPMAILKKMLTTMVDVNRPVPVEEIHEALMVDGAFFDIRENAKGTPKGPQAQVLEFLESGVVREIDFTSPNVQRIFSEFLTARGGALSPELQTKLDAMKTRQITLYESVTGRKFNQRETRGFFANQQVQRFQAKLTPERPESEEGE